MGIRFPVSSILSSIIFLILICLTGAEFCKTVCAGDPCTVNGLPGRATYLRKCTSVLNAFRNGSHLPVVGYYFFEPIVCCPFDGPPPITSTTKSPSITITTTTTPPSSTTTTTTTSQPSSTTTSTTSTESPFTTTTTREPSNAERIVKEKCNAYKSSQRSQEVHKTGFRVVNGTKANETEYPHMAALYKLEHFHCGGTLISERYVVTAAHCTYDLNINQISVYLGVLNLNTVKNVTNAEYQIINKIEHPKYKSVIKGYDIALLKLNKDVNFTKNVFPACLPYSSFENYSEANITGWGRTKFQGNISSDLLKANVPLVPTDACNEILLKAKDQNKTIENFNYTRGISDEQLCAGEKGTDTCQGDSGGPLSVWHENTHVLIGVTSFGLKCAEYPGVYTKVFSYIQWIQSTVWPDSD